MLHGIKRRASRFYADRIDHLCQDPNKRDNRGRGPQQVLNFGDLHDSIKLIEIIQQVLNHFLIDRIRIYQASNLELYGLVKEIPQNEISPYTPPQPLFVQQGRKRPSGKRLPPHLRPASGAHQLL